MTSPPQSLRMAQFELLCGNGGNSVLPTILLLVILYATLSNPSNSAALAGWAVLVTASTLNWWRYANHQRANPPTDTQVPERVRCALALHAIDGMLWGALAWVALDTSSVTGLVLIMAVLTGVAANSMSLLSPVLVVFIGFVVAELAVSALKFLFASDPSFKILGYAGVLFAITIIGQAISASRSARATIGLRFENAALLEQLRAETAVATEAKHEAEMANAAKSKFLAAASHDLRQPIHAQGLFLDLLAQTGLNASQREVLERAQSASSATSDMLNTLLDISRIDAGVVKPVVSVFALGPMLKRIENDLAPVALAKHIGYRSRPTGARLSSDPSLVELIVRNLASNAVRYTDQGGVLISCRKRIGYATIEVWDTGIGIAKDKQDEVFREFHQLGNSERDRRKGLGLGLAIARGMSLAMGLDLTLRSEPGRGSVFKLRVPLADTSSPTDTAEVTAPLERIDPLANLSAQTQLTPDASLKRLRVLFVDDDEAVRRGMVDLLQAWGCECVGASDITQSLVLADSSVPNLVISDYRLRDNVTGTQVIDAVRQHMCAPVAALIITGDTAPQRLREALDSGVSLLHKPVPPWALRRTLARFANEQPGT